MDNSRKLELASASSRDLRDQGDEIIHRANAGELINITSDGEVMATLGPPATSVLEERRRRGHTRPPTTPRSALRGIKRAKSGKSSAEILADSRGRY